MEKILQQQRAYFAGGETLPLAFRLAQLEKLYDSIRAHEGAICAALKADLGKSDFESYMCEIGMILSEISYFRKNLKGLMKEKRVPSPLAQFPARSYRKPGPWGTVLIMSPWNYPVLLTLEPLVDALAAGNTVVLKPSAYAPASAALVEKIVAECFPPCYVAVITGGRRENAALLEQKFDKIFFTGSQAVGREVLRRAAEHLTPVVLELGGKSPCIVDETADLSLAARRIVFGKYLNCGQTCVAPDYILCQETVKPRLLAALKEEICRQFGENPLENPDYGKIINEKHFHRLLALLDRERLAFGGTYREETLQIAPSILDGVSWEDAVMQEEIFGPILPLLTYRDFSRIFSLLEGKPKPLALYIFSQNKDHIRALTSRLRYGGGCVNDVIIHLASSQLPFGGMGESGMGQYHGKFGFETFSHRKSIVDKKTWLDLPLRYQPYNRRQFAPLVRFFLK